MDNEFDKQASKILRENISRDISGERWSEEQSEDHAHREELKKDGYVRLHRKGEFQVRPPWDGSNIARLKSQGWEEVPFPNIRLTLDSPGTASVQLPPTSPDIQKYLDKGYKVVEDYVKAEQSEDDEENEDENLEVTSGDTSADDFTDEVEHTPY